MDGIAFKNIFDFLERFYHRVSKWFLNLSVTKQGDGQIAVCRNTDMLQSLWIETQRCYNFRV